MSKVKRSCQLQVGSQKYCFHELNRAISWYLLSRTQGRSDLHFSKQHRHKELICLHYFFLFFNCDALWKIQNTSRIQICPYSFWKRVEFTDILLGQSFQTFNVNSYKYFTLISQGFSTMEWLFKGETVSYQDLTGLYRTVAKHPGLEQFLQTMWNPCFIPLHLFCHVAVTWTWTVLHLRDRRTGTTIFNTLLIFGRFNWNTCCRWEQVQNFRPAFYDFVY